MNSKIFISHSTSDSETAVAIADALEAVDLKPWLDKREIRPGDSFLERMNEGLGEASYVLLLISEAAHASKWVTREWLAALAADATVLVPILLDDSGLPALLKDIVYIDLRTDRTEGVQKIVNFFQTEIQPPTHSAMRGTGDERDDLENANRRQIRLVATKCLDEAGLRNFCFDADVDPSTIQGSSLNERLVSLLHTVVSEGLLRKFARWLKMERIRCVQYQLEQLRGEPGWDWTVN